MPVLLESPPNPISLKGVAGISQSLADDLSELMLRSEGFTVDEYMTLDGNYFVEYIDGRIQVLPMPDAIHQILTVMIVNLMNAWQTVADPNGRGLTAPFKIKLRDGNYREPDVCYMLGANAWRRTSRSWDRADLAIEIISESNRDHDWITKRLEYALNGISEYWIIEPELRTITVFSLTAEQSEYAIQGEFRDGDIAASKLLAGFAVDVRKLFDDASAKL